MQLNNRIKRFVPPGTLPPGVIADFDLTKNVLRIDKEFYDNATSQEQTHLWRAEGTVVLGRNKR